jgi:hypothetical protein
VALNGRPQLAGGLVGLHGEVEDGGVNGAVQLAANAGVHLPPCVGGRVRRRGAVDVGEKVELPT